ncbi:MAG: thioredoxin domain-containing protein [Candidatus Peribacteraceae bacterium]|nr:thioredoxin domain-containing protein [Candidatus Peribacteraceae bacterium]
MQTFLTTGSLFRGKRRVVLLSFLLMINGLLLIVTMRGVQNLHLPETVVMQHYNEINNPLHNAAASRKPPTPGIGPVVGKASAAVTVVEFTDYECSQCAEYFEGAFQAIRKRYVDTGLVKFEIRNFPLSSVHRQAEAAAVAVLCAAKQQAFEGMHDLLYSNQSEWTAADDPSVFFRSYATNCGISVAQFNACLSSSEIRSALATDITDAQDAGINGTPTFWIYAPDGTVRQINGAYPLETFQTAFDAILE